MVFSLNFLLLDHILLSETLWKNFNEDNSYECLTFGIENVKNYFIFSLMCELKK